MGMFLEKEGDCCLDSSRVFLSYQDKRSEASFGVEDKSPVCSIQGFGSPASGVTSNPTGIPILQYDHDGEGLQTHWLDCAHVRGPDAGRPQPQRLWPGLPRARLNRGIEQPLPEFLSQRIAVFIALLLIKGSNPVHHIAHNLSADGISFG